MTCTRPHAARQILLATRASFSNRRPGCKHNFRPGHFFLFDRAARLSSAPTANHRPLRADAVKTGRLSAATARLGLDSGEHDETLEDVVLPLVHASLVLLPRVMVLYAVGRYRRNIRSEAQVLQCPQRAHA
jgi:hypothetical protein